jgi:ribose/xylose/arabinose/galactoside ABC-type transport system permease subunit
LGRCRAIDEIGAIAALLSVRKRWGSRSATDSSIDEPAQAVRQACYGIMSVGMVLLLSMGEIDLSVGAILR